MERAPRRDELTPIYVLTMLLEPRGRPLFLKTCSSSGRSFRKNVPSSADDSPFLKRVTRPFHISRGTPCSTSSKCSERSFGWVAPQAVPPHTQHEDLTAVGMQSQPNIKQNSTAPSSPPMNLVRRSGFGRPCSLSFHDYDGCQPPSLLPLTCESTACRPNARLNHPRRTIAVRHYTRQRWACHTWMHPSGPRGSPRDRSAPE